MIEKFTSETKKEMLKRNLQYILNEELIAQTIIQKNAPSKEYHLDEILEEEIDPYFFLGSVPSSKFYDRIGYKSPWPRFPPGNKELKEKYNKEKRELKETIYNYWLPTLKNTKRTNMSQSYLAKKTKVAKLIYKLSNNLKFENENTLLSFAREHQITEVVKPETIKIAYSDIMKNLSDKITKNEFNDDNLNLWIKALNHPYTKTGSEIHISFPTDYLDNIKRTYLAFNDTYIKKFELETKYLNFSDRFTNKHDIKIANKQIIDFGTLYFKEAMKSRNYQLAYVLAKCTNLDDQYLTSSKNAIKKQKFDKLSDYNKVTVILKERGNKVKEYMQGY